MNQHLRLTVLLAGLAGSNLLQSAGIGSGWLRAALDYGVTGLAVALYAGAPIAAQTRLALTGLTLGVALSATAMLEVGASLGEAPSALGRQCWLLGAAIAVLALAGRFNRP